MKTKNLLIAGAVALALLGTSAGTASASPPPVAGGTDSTNAADFSTELFILIQQQALPAAGNSGDLVQYVMVYDIYVLSYLCMAIVSGYNSGGFDLSLFLSDNEESDLFVDAGVGFELALAMQAYAINLQNTGNPFAAQIGFFSEQIMTSLQSAIVDGD